MIYSSERHIGYSADIHDIYGTPLSSAALPVIKELTLFMIFDSLYVWTQEHSKHSPVKSEIWRYNPLVPEFLFAILANINVPILGTIGTNGLSQLPYCLVLIFIGINTLSLNESQCMSDAVC